MKRMSVILLFGAIVFSMVLAKASTFPGSPWEMAIATERWFAQGSSARFPVGMSDTARDGNNLAFVDESWPLAFQERIGEKISVRLSSVTGCYEFTDEEGIVFWIVVPDTPVTWNWISPFRLPFDGDTNGLYDPFRLALEWRLTTEVIEMGRPLSLRRRVQLRSVPPGPATNLCTTAFAITNDVLFFTADWPTNEVLPNDVLDVWCSTNLSEWAWTNIWTEPASNPPLSFAFSRELVPNCGLVSPHVHEPTCSPFTNIVVSPLDGSTAYTNETWSCETNRAWRVEPAFFRLGTRADNDNDGIVDAWERFVYGTNPDSTDTDGDAIDDGAEQLLGTDPLNSDTDGDTMPDGWELSHGLNPLDYFDSILDLDDDGIPNVYEFHNDTEPCVSDLEYVPSLVVGGTEEGSISIKEAFEQSWPYAVIVLRDGLYQGSDWTGLWFPSHPVLLMSENAGRFRRTVLRHSGSQMAAFYFDSEQSPHTIIRGLDVELAGTSGFQTAFWLGNGSLYRGPGASVLFQNVHVRLGKSASHRMGWFCRHSTSYPTVLSGCSVDAAGAASARGIYAIDSPGLLLEGCSFLNFPDAGSGPAYGIQTESTHWNYGGAVDPVNVEIKNCLFDASFTNAFVIAPLTNGVSFDVSMRSCAVPSTPVFPANLTSNLIVSGNLVRTDGHLVSGSGAINVGSPLVYWNSDFDGEPRDSSPDIGADEWVAGSSVDSDGDGLTNDDELLVWGTDPFRFDTDGDGVSDNEEVSEETDPNDAGHYCFVLSGTIQSSVTSSNVLRLAVVATNASPIRVLSSVLPVGGGLSPFSFSHTVATNAPAPEICLFADLNQNGFPDEGESAEYVPLILTGHTTVASNVFKTATDDQDGDMMPDDWELAHGLCFTNALDAVDDPDGDGLANLHEYWQGTNPWIADGSNTVLSVLARSIDDRLIGKNPETALPFFLDYPNLDSGLWTNALIANPDCWASDIDFSCESPWNAEIRNRKSGTLISPIHMLLAKHHTPPAVGTRFYFRDADGNIYVRRIQAKQVIVHVPTNDLVVALLDSALPESIKPAKILPADYADYIRTGRGLPAISLDQEGKILVSEITNLASSETSTTSSRANSRRPLSPLRSEFYEILVPGDSSNPKFLLLDDQPILLSIHWDASHSGSSIRCYADLLNSAMTDLSPSLNYQIESVDFSNFAKLPEAPQ